MIDNELVQVIRDRVVEGDLFRGSRCQLYTGTTNRGYGRIYFKGKNYLTHRVMWEVENGRFQDGLCADHLCRNRSCCNHLHLEPVTRGENTRRGLVSEANKARFSKITHCCRGHEFTPENTTYYKAKSNLGIITCRRCRACTNTRRIYLRKIAREAGAK